MSTVSIKAFEGPVLVTAAFILMYYTFLFSQSLTKFYLYLREKSNGKDNIKYAKIKYGSTDRMAITADRSVGNLLEQSIPFLVSLWLNAVFVSPGFATQMGWYYIFARALYPFVFYMGMPYLLISTLPGYAFIFVLLGKVVLVAYN